MKTHNRFKSVNKFLNFNRLTVSSLIAFTLTAFNQSAALASDDGARKLFVSSAFENTADNTVVLPFYKGRSSGKSFYYMVLDASNGDAAKKFGVNRSDKLNNAKNTAAVQKVRLVNGVIEFPATVDFRPERSVTPSSTGFPPLAVQPGAVGQPGYSPLIQLPDGTILNAPHIANDTGQADKIVSLDMPSKKVIYRQSEGFANGKEVYYISTDASDFAAAALEGVTFAPQLNNAPFLGGDSKKSARAALAAFVNGQTGSNNSERQGLNSALLDGLDPLNVIAWTPNQGRYSPLWDVYLAMWQPSYVANGSILVQTDFGDIVNLAKDNAITAIGGSMLAPAGFIVNCPVISQVK